MIAGADHLCFEPIAAEIDNPIKLKIIPTSKIGNGISVNEPT